MDGIVRIAAIGVGNRTTKYLQYVSNNPEKVCLAAIVETDASRRDFACKTFGLSEDVCFGSVDDFFNSSVPVDAVIIGTPDDTHCDICLKAIDRKYHVLLEKPIANTMEDCIRVADAAKEAGVLIYVCYVLRYHPYYEKIKEIISSGVLGEIMTISHSMNVGIDRMTHTYVRGPWSKSKEACPLLLSKCCHDIDILLWLLDRKIAKVSSFGSLMWFRKENAPEGSSDRCISCAIEKDCPFSAVTLYKRRRSWINNFIPEPGRTKEDAIEYELTKGRFGRCVYRCDNDVVDHQVVNMEMEDGVTVSVCVDSMTRDDNRFTSIKCTKGELIADESRIVVRYLSSEIEDQVYDYSELFTLPLHAGADLFIVEDFINQLREDKIEGRVQIADTLDSHIACFLAEESRESGEIKKVSSC